MADKMLIDASHEEETRVVVVRGSRIEEFDFESQHKKQLRGNIYLAKVTRVEPSLQAAFVDYGGNRHGFLAFSEIHPDYYQIPLADRQALLAAEAEAEAERARREADDDDDDDQASEAEVQQAEAEEKPKAKRGRGRRSGRGAKKNAEPTGEGESADAAETENEGEEVEIIDTAAKDLEGAVDDDGGQDGDQADADTDSGDGEGGPRSMAAIVETDSVSEPVDAEGGDDDDADVDPGEVDLEAAEFVEGKSEEATRPRRSRRRSGRSRGDGDDKRAGSEDDDGERRTSGRRDEHEEDSRVESVGAEDAMEEVPDRSVRKPRKQYRIQEVIKRRQILLVQVVKEERGNKGAALTTYLSLAGRYSVLMPNTARGGGISRKITNIQDRKRLKEVAKGLEVPQGMGVILRTAGANRTKAEIKRDFEYLMRLWENVRSLTLASTAPCLVYEEGSLIKRSIRDLYNKDIGQIVVAGEEGYREAKDFMKMLMPSHAKVVQPYRDVHPIFSRSGIEAQLDRMLQPQVTLKSGGYIIINQTEALVAIDVNSGRSTKEHSIEDTALQTNLEAADEVARQLRLRDLAGLIVVDFIDMEEKRNNRSVEKRLKDALKNDRARIQVGRISHFGLLEMSRQRIRASVLESTTQICDHCGGTGHVRSQSSVALHVIRSVEEFLLKSTTHDIVVRTMPTTALYVLNQKRETIIEMERRFGVVITIEADTSIGSSHLEIDRGAAVEVPVRIEDILPAAAPVEDEDDDVPVDIVEDDEDEAEEPVSHATPDEGDSQQKRKRRRRRRGGRDRDHDERAPAEGGDEAESEPVAAAHEGDGEDGERPKKRRRRGKRGGRRNRGDEAAAHGEAAGETSDAVPVTADDEAAEAPAEDAREPVEAAAAEEALATHTEAVPAAAEAVPAETTAEEPPAEKPKRRRSRSKKAEAETKVEAPAEEQRSEEPAEAVAQIDEAEAAPAAEKAPARAGAKSAATGPVVVSTGNAPEAGKDAETADKPKKVGWWQRRSFF